MLKDKVIKNYSKLNDTDLYMWKYINENRDVVINKTISELSKILNVSNTTILRFTHKIELEGYSEFKYLIKSEAQLDTNIYSVYYFEKSCDYFIKYVN